MEHEVENLYYVSYSDIDTGLKYLTFTANYNLIPFGYESCSMNLAAETRRLFWIKTTLMFLSLVKKPPRLAISGYTRRPSRSDSIS
jgi:hypothetical protein